MSKRDLQDRIRKLKRKSLTNPPLNTHNKLNKELTMETKMRLHDFVVDGVKINVLYTEHDDGTYTLKASSLSNLIPLLSESQVAAIISKINELKEAP